MSRIRTEMITCPHCGKEKEVVLWDSLNAELNPEEKKQLLDGTLFKFNCECGHTANIAAPMLYHDMTHQVMVQYVIEDAVDETLESFNKMGNAGFMKGYKVRFVTSHNSLREKVLIFDEGLDDRMMEIIKVYMYSNLLKQHPESEFDEALFYKEDGKWFLQFIGELSAVAELNDEMYKAVCDDFEECLNADVDNEVFIDFDWAINYINENLEESMYEQVKRIFNENDIEMTEREIGLYATMFEIISEFTSHKLTTEEIFTSYDYLSDLMFDRRTEFAVHVSKEDRIRVQLRAMEILEETKGKLTKEEKEKYAFCVYFANCIKIYNEETGITENGITGFTSLEYIEGEFQRFKEREPERFEIVDEEDDAYGEAFGYSMLNPVLAVSVEASYRYLRRLYVQGQEMEWNRIGSFTNPKGGILDGYEITVTKRTFLRKEVKKHTIYINPYAGFNSSRAPEGFSLY